ncbi:MAG: citrate synthase [Bacteroidia bacterium]|nr:citrate synthase [Bacteroidia bacterium]
MNETAELKLGDITVEFPVITGSENEKGIDISSLRGKSGYITLDLGYKNTGSCTSAITFLDGELGILRHRGYSIEDLADKASFIEVAFLVIYGELPTKDQLAEFEAGIKEYLMPPAGIQQMLKAFPSTGHPMGMLSSAICALHAWYPESLNAYRPEDQKALTYRRLLGFLPAISAWIYCVQNGQDFTKADASLDYSENFMKMMFNKDVAPAVVSAINKLLILHVDHEQNCSASTVRMVGSSHANLYASISAGIDALWGPLHGGANQKVIEMLEAIKADGGDADKWLAKAKDKDDPFRLMGFGHRVYKNFDPRARIIKKAADEVLNNLGIVDPVLEIAKALESKALADPYFAERKLYPNVDFYSGIIYRALGIPTEMFTVMFAIGRLPGWIAQWREMRIDGDPIGRPRQIYTGYPPRDFVAMENR